MTIPDIIDNSEYQLFDVLNELLETRKPVDFASGFFNIGGYALVREKLDGISRFRFLLGREPSTVGLPAKTGRPTQLIDIHSAIHQDLAGENLSFENKTRGYYQTCVTFCAVNGVCSVEEPKKRK